MKRALGGLLVASVACSPTATPIGAGAEPTPNEVDSGVALGPCDQPVVNGIAHWAFEEDLNTGQVLDSIGSHHGTLIGGQWDQVPGPEGCGNALRFEPDNADTYVEIPASSEFQLSRGSVDFWIYPETCDTAPYRFGGLITRDQQGVEGDGHLAVRFSDDCAASGTFVGSSPDCTTITADNDCRITVRLQGLGESHFVTSSTQIALDTWTHVGINFDVDSGMELFLDGQLAGSLDSAGVGTVGNDRALVFGASNGSAPTIDRFLRNVTLDNIRLSSSPREF